MQLNVELPNSELLAIKMDALKMGVTLQEYSLKAFQSFLSKPIDGRRSIFPENRHRLLGRKIKVGGKCEVK
jgi:hypothetical protein